MKKLILTFASLCLIFSIYSCRETTEEKAEDAMEEAAQDVETNVEEAGDAIEEAAEEVEEEIDDATDDDAQ